jgi:hypothetical protein
MDFISRRREKSVEVINNVKHSLQAHNHLLLSEPRSVHQHQFRINQNGNKELSGK